MSITLQLSLHGPLRLQLGLLDCATQLDSEHALWIFLWSWHVHFDIRLGADRLRAVPSCHSMVGTGQCPRRLRALPLDHHFRYVLQQRLVHAVPTHFVTSCF